MFLSCERRRRTSVGGYMFPKEALQQFHRSFTKAPHAKALGNCHIPYKVYGTVFLFKLCLAGPVCFVAGLIRKT